MTKDHVWRACVFEEETGPELPESPVISDTFSFYKHI